MQSSIFVGRRACILFRAAWRGCMPSRLHFVSCRITWLLVVAFAFCFMPRRASIFHELSLDARRDMIGQGLVPPFRVFSGETLYPWVASRLGGSATDV